MKKVYLIFAALTSVALFSCTGDELAENAPVTNPEVERPIVFSSLNKGMTRADYIGKDAAEKLNYKFVVAGKKGSSTAATDGVVVFDNYLVEYTENTAHTTESNVANWEYVGKGRIKPAIDHGITRQTIKYWDYYADQYDFIAWSTGSKTAIFEGNPAGGQVLVSAIDPNATATGAYTFTGTADDLSQCYISDLTTVKKAQYGDDPVKLSFRQLGTKVRIGIYETIPGYSVKDVKFYTKGGLLTKTGGVLDADQIVDDATLFSAGADIYTEGTYTVTFPSVDGSSATDDNKAHVTFAPKSGVTQTTTIKWGGLNYTIAEEGEKKGTKFLGRTSSTASFAGDAANNYYVIYLPNETGANLNLRVDFTLEAIDGGGEEIHVKNAKAQVPSIYTTWKPGYAYTYLFKISDKTNGRTGVYDPTQADDATVNSDPAGLYPITFDAVVENAEDNDATQETITTVMTPSITTYQQKSTVVNADEYTVNGQDIFVTVNEGDALVTLTGKAALYTIPASKTEAEVVDALQMQDDDAAAGTIKGRSGLVLTQATAVADITNIDAADKYALTNSVQFGADGNAITVGTDQALRFRPAANTTYAFVYTKTASTTTTDYFEPISIPSLSGVSGYYRYAYAAAPYSYHHVDDNGTPGDASDDITTEYFDAQKGVKYFSYIVPNYSIEANVFIGQGVNNLYLDAAGNTIASGYAKSEVTYYYTTNNGMSYTAAHNVNYADFGGSLFVEGTTPGTYVANTDATPQDGTAYYYYDSVNDKYIYCVILPQQVKGWFIQDTTAAKVACGATETAIVGQTYFDKYTKNDGEYYVKVIKVQ
ncbi:hypothetical protein [uncultured Prevotella sp.]|uniref:hypothetical protein n=1 Tax=uncultured Prevotella sp. TaxID=159272 RepID=UPI0025F11C6C|nr:hypothetical protein [uncultured Prevotella sp.]